MEITAIPGLLELVEKLRKLLERCGAFLCRRKIAALKADLAAAHTHLEQLKREACEIKAEFHIQHERLEVAEKRLALRDKFRRVAIGDVAVYALRRSAANDGEPPRLVCPVCFETDNLHDLIVSRHNVCVAVNTFQEQVHLSCPDNGCDFRAIATPEAFRQSFKLAD